MNCIFKNMFCHQYPNRARIIILFHPCPFYRQSRTWCIHIGFIRLIIKDWVLSFCFRFKLCTWCYQKCTHIKGAHFVLVSFIFCSWQVAGLDVLIKYKRHADSGLHLLHVEFQAEPFIFRICSLFYLKNACMISRFVS